jgi:hypothetical protein
MKTLVFRDWQKASAPFCAPKKPVFCFSSAQCCRWFFVSCFEKGFNRCANPSFENKTNPGTLKTTREPLSTSDQTRTKHSTFGTRCGRDRSSNRLIRQSQEPARHGYGNTLMDSAKTGSPRSFRFVIRFASSWDHERRRERSHDRTFGSGWTLLG